MKRLTPLVIAALIALLAACGSHSTNRGQPTTSHKVSPLSFGTNSGLNAKNIGLLSVSGNGLVRNQAIEGTDTILTAQMDATATTLAQNHLTWYPILGIPPTRKTSTGQGDAAVVAQYASAFAQRFGRGGTFWAEHACPGDSCLPYEPVTNYEIGNEVNADCGNPCGFADQTNLHYVRPSGSINVPVPSSYAVVYKAARAALHAVDSHNRAIVGGLAPFELKQVQGFLVAFLKTSGPVDAVGWHPYLASHSSAPAGPPTEADMMTWTQALRQTLNDNGHSLAGIDLNEFDSDPTDAGSSAAWGSWVAQFTEWALCTPALKIGHVITEWWGGFKGADEVSNGLFDMDHDDGTLTDYGQAFIGEARKLTTTGCSTTTSTSTSTSSSLSTSTSSTTTTTSSSDTTSSDTTSSSTST